MHLLLPSQNRCPSPLGVGYCSDPPRSMDCQTRHRLASVPRVVTVDMWVKTLNLSLAPSRVKTWMPSGSLAAVFASGARVQAPLWTIQMPLSAAAAWPRHSTRSPTFRATPSTVWVPDWVRVASLLATRTGASISASWLPSSSAPVASTRYSFPSDLG